MLFLELKVRACGLPATEVWFEANNLLFDVESNLRNWTLLTYNIQFLVITESQFLEKILC